MSNTNKLINILLLVIIITVILFVSSPVLNSIHTNNDLDIKYNEYIKLNDSLNNEIRILNETTKRLNIVIDSSRSNIKIIERIKYEKINNIDNLTPDSILSILTNYLSAKSKDR